MVEYDVLIKKVTIVDGTGKKPFVGNMGIIDEKVAALGEIKDDAVQTIEGNVLTAFPGFIDSHSHADTTLLSYPKCESARALYKVGNYDSLRNIDIIIQFT